MQAITHTLNNRYCIEREIGRGGMATVYLAWDELLRREVAVKVLSDAYAADLAFVERFKREACAMANLTHRNIVAVYDWGESNGTYFMVMEYVPGRTLKEVLRERGSLPEAETLTIVAQIVVALNIAHEHGIIHRDIKPHNILVSPEGRVKVTDFGIARVAGTSNLTAAQMILGTVQYLSPEQVLHHPVDGRADLYSLGIVLYELLTGSPPFAGDSIAAVALQHVNTAPTSVRVRRPEVSPAAGAIVEKALAKLPERRYQTAMEFHTAIEEARTYCPGMPPKVGPRAIAAPPSVEVYTSIIPFWRSAPRELSRLRWLATLPLLVVFALLLRGGGGAFGASLMSISDVGAVSASTVRVAPSATNVALPTVDTASLFVGLKAPLPAATVTGPSVVAESANLTTTATATTQPAPTLAPTPAHALATVQAARPQEAVLTFYQLVASHRFDVATALWSPQLRAQSSPEKSINERYAQTARILVQHWEVTDQTADHATVAIVISEYKQGTNTHQNYQGTWHLIHTDAGWLLDAQDVQLA